MVQVFGVWDVIQERQMVPTSVKFLHMLESYLDSGFKPVMNNSEKQKQK